MEIIQVEKLYKYFSTPAGKVAALDDINFSVSDGEFIGIVGKSGSGKSTLINMLAGIDRPSSGSINVRGSLLQEMDEGQLSVWRGANIGIVFQFFQLLPVLTVLENILLPMDFLDAIPIKDRTDRAYEILDQVGIADIAGAVPADLSGGQQQMTAIARALANDPPILIADEPTGNLDPVSAEKIVGLFERLSVQSKTILMVTHDSDMVAHTDRILRIRDGKLAD